MSNKLKNIADSQAEDLQIKLPEALESLNNKSITLYCFKANDSNMTKLIEESIEKFYKYFENGKCNKTFELIKKIGKGKNSIVYKAKHLLDGQFYAVKIIKLYVGIKENIQEQKMFREVLSMAKLNSKYLLRYHSS